MTPQHHLPADIERTSISIITRELDELGLTPPPETAAVVKRVIHTTADFDYAKNLRFTPGAVEAAVKALHAGAFIVTDTNMALAGITKPGLKKLNGEAIWPKPQSRRAPPVPLPPCTALPGSTRGPFWPLAMRPRPF